MINYTILTSNKWGMIMNHYDNLVQALQYLSSVCDGAQEQDGSGFNGIDSPFGKSLAEQSYGRTLSDGQIAAAVKLLQKYRGQVESAGIQLPHESDFQIATETKIVQDGNSLLVYAPATPKDSFWATINSVKTIPGRKWEPNIDGKPWRVPGNQVAMLRGLFPDVPFEFEAANLPEPEPVKIQPATISKNGNGYQVRFDKTDPSFSKKLDAVRNLPNRQWVADGGYWLVADIFGIETLLKNHSYELDEATRQDLQAHKTVANRSERPDGFEVPGVHGEPFPFQLDGVYLADKANGRLIIGDDMGLGKAQPLDAKILTPQNGWVEMGSIKAGDYVVGQNGKPTKVTAVYPQGEKDIYKITFSDGFSTECCEDHLWQVNTSVRKYRNSAPMVMNLSEIMQAGLKHKSGNRKYFIPIAQSVEFENCQPLMIHPYVMGVLLGDGSIGGNTPALTTADDELAERVFDLLPDNVFLKKNRSDKYGYYLSSDASHGEYSPMKFSVNPLTFELRLLGLLGKLSYDKYIPESYKFNTVENRIELLRGLMDTDGWVNKGERGNAVQFCSVSKRLADDVVFLAQSLGGVARMTFKKNNHAGAWIVTLSLPNEVNPFWLKRKAELVIPRTKYEPSRFIESIEYVGKKQAQCIAVDSKDHLYLTDHFIVTHNTVQSLMYLQLHPELRPAVIVPPASVKTHWKRQYRQWLKSNDRIEVLEGVKPKLLPTADIYIINYDILAAWLPLLLKANIKAAIADEAHYLKNPKAARTKAFDTLAKQCKAVLLLTGTAVQNRPAELWKLLNLVAPKSWPKWFDFAMRYCDPKKQAVRYRDKQTKRMVNREIWDFSGASNLPELHERIKPYFIRRMKKDVLTLGEKTRITVTLDVPDSKLQSYNAAMRDAMAKLIKDGKEDSAQLVMFEKAKQAAFEAKFEAAVEWVGNLLDSGRKLVLFATHKDAARRLTAAFADVSVTITGETSQKARNLAVDRFQNDDKCRLLVGNIQAAGVGLTLTAASDVAFVEFDWTPANHQQAEDRVNRIGQTAETIQAWYLVLPDTIEEAIVQLLYQKSMIVSAVLDGTTDKLQNASIFGEFLNILKKGG